MTSFIIESAICMAVLLAVYHLLLEKEKMHKFNRFYLLFSLVFSLAVPFIAVPVYTEAVAEIIYIPPVIDTDTVPAAPAQEAEKPDYVLYILLSIYVAITFVLALRFTKNIYSIYKKIASGTLVRYQHAKLVLLDEKTVPHTFADYVFLNKKDYTANRIERELYIHELTHVSQKHTLDLLFVEALKVIFWFNPLLYFYRKAMQLNHEFLADEAVAKADNDIATYQQLLLQKADPQFSLQFASSLTYSLTKKRFIMMTKTTSGIKAVFLQTASLTLTVCLTLLFCATTAAQEITPTIDFKKVRKIEVATPSPKELDSLKKANPAKFKDEPNTRILRTNYTLNEDGKQKIVTTYEQDTTSKQELSEGTMKSISDIDPNKMTAIKVDNVTETEIASLVAKDPKKYKNAKAEDFRSITVTYRDENDREVEKTYYECYKN